MQLGTNAERERGRPHHVIARHLVLRLEVGNKPADRRVQPELERSLRVVSHERCDHTAHERALVVGDGGRNGAEEHADDVHAVSEPEAGRERRAPEPHEARPADEEIPERNGQRTRRPADPVQPQVRSGEHHTTRDRERRDDHRNS